MAAGTYFIWCSESLIIGLLASMSRQSEKSSSFKTDEYKQLENRTYKQSLSFHCHINTSNSNWQGN